MIALSSSAMHQLLNICHKYSTDHSLLYNLNKSLSMCFKPSTIKFTRPWFFLAGMKIPIVTHCKYLGVIMSEYNKAISQTVIMLSIAINRAEHVCTTVIIKYNYMLMCNHRIVINIMLCLLNSTGHI